VRIFCTILFVLFGNGFLFAQNSNNDIQLNWENSNKDISARISITAPLENTNKKITVYFINMVDSVGKEYNNKNENFVFNDVSSLFTLIRISLFQMHDSEVVPNFSTLSKVFVNDIMPFIHKQYPLSKIGDGIIAGENAGAEIALNTSLNFSEKFNKTALFFDKYLSGFSYIKDFVKTLTIKGKLFISENHKGGKFDTVDGLAHIVGLNSSVMIYKLDNYEDENVDLFKYGYNWLLADGNNIILKTEY
jgi:hypothetical protein